MMPNPKQIDVIATGSTYSIQVFSNQNITKPVDRVPVNIFASGPSISDLDFNQQLTQMPSMFVNGSLTLIAEHDFTNVIAYVISDSRFIKHNAQILEQHYHGQPLYITKPVIDAICKHLPKLIANYSRAMRIIYPVDRPLHKHKEKRYLKSISLLSKIKNNKLQLADFKAHTDFVIDSSNSPKPIGVSLNIENGFVEAGTVAFVATQLAYTLKASEISLYGIDLINSNQPRFYENKDNLAPCKLDKAITDRIIPSFDLLGSVYAERGVRVINRSPVSKDLFRTI